MSKIINAKNICISPEDINTDKHFFGAFGNIETEVSANYIVSLCKKKGGWFSFSKKEIEELYNSFGHKGFWFNELIPKYIIEKNGEFFINSEFIMRCYNSSPVPEKGKC